jgi:hypothetical protein
LLRPGLPWNTAVLDILPHLRCRNQRYLSSTSARAFSRFTLSARGAFIRFFLFSVSVIRVIDISIFYGQIAIDYFQFLFGRWTSPGYLQFNSKLPRSQYDSDAAAPRCQSECARSSLRPLPCFSRRIFAVPWLKCLMLSGYMTGPRIS